MKMSFVINSMTLNIMCLFGICPYKYNHITQTIDCSFFRLFYSCVYFLMTSVSLDYALVIYFSHKILTVGVVTYEIAKIIENTARLIIHNTCMIDLMLRRKSYVLFLNKLNNFQRSIESELGCKVRIKQENIRSMVIIVLIIAYLLLISVITYIINWHYLRRSVIFWYVMAVFKYLSFTLVGVNICNLNMTLLRRYEDVFEKISSLIVKFSCEETKDKKNTSKGLAKCFEKLEESNAIKLKFSDLFGTQILLIVSSDFVSITIAFYFVLFPSIFVEYKHFSGLIHFALLNLPCLVILCWMVVIMDKLGQQVSLFIV